MPTKRRIFFCFFFCRESPPSQVDPWGRRKRREGAQYPRPYSRTVPSRETETSQGRAHIQRQSFWRQNRKISTQNHGFRTGNGAILLQVRLKPSLFIDFRGFSQSRALRYQTQIKRSVSFPLRFHCVVAYTPPAGGAIWVLYTKINGFGLGCGLWAVGWL